VRFCGLADFAEDIAKFIGDKGVALGVRRGCLQRSSKSFFSAGVVPEGAVYSGEGFGGLGQAVGFPGRFMPDGEGGFEVCAGFFVANKLVQDNAQIIGGKTALLRRCRECVRLAEKGCGVFEVSAASRLERLQMDA